MNNPKRFWVGLLLASQLWVMQSSIAQQCFADVERAYAYMLSQEKGGAGHKSAKAAQKMININTATEAQLTTLKGIGSSKAKAIIMYRDAFGHFKSVDALTDVKGIGEKTVANNRERLLTR